MDARALIDFLGRLEKLKSNTRHSWTKGGTRECVAAHSWRLSVMALLLDGEVQGVDMGRVLKMCLVHDFGEAVTGDIPAFQKTQSDEVAEVRAVKALLLTLPEKRDELALLFAEMDAMQTPEARAYKALDKMEAVLQHNESALDTWLPLEYDLQKTYGIPEAAEFPTLKALRQAILDDTLQKTQGRRAPEGTDA